MRARPRCLPGCCWEGLQLFLPPRDHEEERRDFERTVAFLASVPLFCKQLPRSQLPKVAQGLTRRVWQPGQRLVRQGETGRALFFIEAGEALVVTCPGQGEAEHIRTVLGPGDYFGGHTLITERPNVATIVAGGDRPLVTLSMSRKAFEDSGLRHWLQFPKRPAIYEDRPHAPCQDSAQLAKKSVEEEAFIQKAVRLNPTIKALLQASDEQLCSIASVAERREVRKGTVVARCGEIGKEFFIVRDGSFNIVLDDFPEIGGQSAEAAVANSAMAERLLRKQHFLQELSQLRPSEADSRQVGCRRAASHYQGTRRSAASETPWQREPPTARGCEGTLDGACELPSRGKSSESLNLVPALNVMVCRRSLRQPRQGPRQRGEAEPQAASAAPLVLGQGDSFGELSLLYNTAREATFQAREDSVVYVVHQRDFAECFSRRDNRFHEYRKLLDEVHALTPLLSSERWELACSAKSFMEFKPGERILHQGQVQQARHWYVIFSGSCVLSRQEVADGQARTRRMAELHRAGHFGERSLLRGDPAAEVSVDAGQEGLCCLTFDGENIRILLEVIFCGNESMFPSVHSDIEEWCASKEKGWHCRSGGATSSRAPSWERQVSGARAGATCDVQLAQLRKICTLGRGGWGQVCLVEDFVTGRRYALKTVSKGHVQQRDAGRLISWERELLSLVDSPFVIHLHRTFRDSQHVYFLLEAALGGSLVEVLRSHPEVLTEDKPRGSSAAFYAACCIAALQHLHDRRIVHRDLKPENALLDEHGYAKVCDMGFARFVLQKTNTLAGTPEYMAPEMIDFPHTHDISVDWWALGVLTYELLAGQTPWQDEGISDPMGRLLAIRRSQEQGGLCFPFHFPHVAKDFVAQLLQKLPRRLGAEGDARAVWQHSMFSCLKFDYEAFRAMRLRSPFCRESSPDFVATDDLGMDQGDLGLAPEDSIFVPFECGDEQEGAWDADF